MLLEYNGVALRLLNIQSYNREVVYSADNTEALYVRHTLNVIATYGPGGAPVPVAVAGFGLNGPRREMWQGDPARSRDLVGNCPYKPVPFPVPEQDSTTPRDLPPAALTDAALTNLLLTPRKKLKITVWDQENGRPHKRVWLESPRRYKIAANGTGITALPKDEAPCDSANGPLPLAANVVGVEGEGMSFGVQFGIQTCLPISDHMSDKLVLSHRWEQSHGHDANNYLTATTRGVLVFDGGILRGLNLTPDVLRNQLLHPIPLGMERKIPEIDLSADGLTLSYTLVDTDPTVVFDPGASGATTMTIVETLNHLIPNTVVSSVAEAGQRMWEFATNSTLRNSMLGALGGAVSNMFRR